MRGPLTAIAIAGALALAATSAAQAAIVALPTRSLEATEGSPVPNDKFILFEDAGPCAASAYSITIRWGDGFESPGNIIFTDPFFRIPGPGPDPGEPASCAYGATGDHTYQRPGTFALGARICRGAAECVDANGGSAFVAGAAIRGEAASVAGVAGQLLTAEVAEFNDDNRSSQPSDFTASIAWGDGSTSSGLLAGQNGRFDVSGQHVYTAPGTYLLRVTLLEAGVPVAVSDPGTVTVVAGPAGLAAPVAANGLAAVQQTAASLVGPVRSTMRLGFRAVSRRALRRGLPIRVSLPSTIRSLRIAILRIGARSTRLGAATVRVRGGSVLRGVRTVSLRVPLSAALRRTMRPGVYALRFSVGAGPATTARFRVRR